MASFSRSSQLPWHRRCRQVHAHGGKFQPSDNLEIRLTSSQSNARGKSLAKTQPNETFDPNVELVSSLLSAATNQLQQAASSAQEALGSGLGRAMRLIEPPPKGLSRMDETGPNLTPVIPL